MKHQKLLLLLLFTFITIIVFVIVICSCCFCFSRIIFSSFEWFWTDELFVHIIRQNVASTTQWWWWMQQLRHQWSVLGWFNWWWTWAKEETSSLGRRLVVQKRKLLFIFVFFDNYNHLTCSSWCTDCSRKLTWVVSIVLHKAWFRKVERVNLFNFSKFLFANRWQLSKITKWRHFVFSYKTTNRKCQRLPSCL